MPASTMIKGLCCCVLFLWCSIILSAQDSARGGWEQRYVTTVQKKAVDFNETFGKRTGKMLRRLMQMEKNLRDKATSQYTNLDLNLFNYSIDSLQQIEKRITGKIDGLLKQPGEYFPYFDSLQQSLNFLQSGKELPTTSLTSSLQETRLLGNNLAISEKINEFLKQRNDILQSELGQYHELNNSLNKLKKEAVYYQNQVQTWKEALRDKEKMEKIAMSALRKVPAFQKFLQQHSQLAGLFMPPGSFGSMPSGNGMELVNGIEPRAAVQQAIQNSIPTSGINASQLMQQQVNNAVGEMDKIKDRLNKEGGMGDKEVPGNTNSQRSKSFRKRLEFGTDFQFGPANNYLPATSNLGLQLGYRLNDKTSMGIGAAYKLGLGSGWNNIRFTSESIGLRTYMRAKLKGQFYAQGGGEWNYMTRFEDIEALKNLNAWQTSALLGAGKSYKVGKKLKGNILVFYDFLHRKNKPASQPVLFRIGYNF